MTKIMLPKRRPLYNLFLTVTAISTLGFLVFAGYYFLQVGELNQNTISSGVESVLLLVVAITLVCVLVVNVIYTRESVRVVERTLVHIKYWSLFRLQAEIALDEIKEISVKPNRSASHFSESQDFALRQFGYLELLVGDTKIELANGYSLAVLNSVAKKLASHFSPSSSGGSQLANISLYEHLSGIEARPEADSTAAGSGGTDISPVQLAANPTLHPSTIKSLLICLGLFFMAGFIAYLDQNPTEAMVSRQGHVIGELAAFYLLFTSIGVIYFALFCWYFRKSSPASKFLLGSSTLQLFGSSGNSQGALTQIHKSQIAVAYVDGHKKEAGSRNSAAYELVLLDHALNRTVLVLDGEKESLLKGAYKINSWLKQSF